MANTKYPRKELSQAEKTAKYKEEQRQLRLEAKMREACEKEIENERKIIFKRTKAHFKKLGYDTSNYGVQKKVNTELKLDNIPVYILELD
jgi:hypothetical protein